MVVSGAVNRNSHEPPSGGGSFGCAEAVPSGPRVVSTARGNASTNRRTATAAPNFDE
ncbi:hypothetical protein I549_4344 [Mycobacterium avium subsp. avium 2285 (R)]|nr:hypothetical protein I549_4344 [Mycobacterium avium subsp. avium 2285 (R)]